MAYTERKKQTYKYDDKLKANLYIVEIQCDTTADMPDPAEHPEWAPGSELKVLEDGGKKYTLSNAGEWVETPNFSGGGKGGDVINAQQLTPEFAESVEWLEANGDPAKVYVLPDGYSYAYTGGAWTNSGCLFTSFDTLEKVIAATCDIEVVEGGNYNLFKLSEVSYSSRLQDDVEGVVSSNANNAVTGWMPVKYGKCYAMSVLYDGSRTTQPGGAGSMYTRMNAQKSDGTVIVYNRGAVPLSSDVEYSKQVIVIEDPDIVAIRLHFNVNTQDISTASMLKAYAPMFVAGDTAEQAYQKRCNV